MNQSLAIAQEITPAQFSQQIETAKAKAKTLAALVEDAHLAVQIGPSKHLRVEAWETIGRAYGLTVGTGDTMLLADNLGVKATAYVYDGGGVVVGRADGYCMREESQWATKPIAQLAGMAQTRAVSRALRQILAWVVVLAGYSATPAEEMEADSKPLSGKPSPVGSPLLCPIHNIEWFKRGKMREFAHPVDGGKWCNKAAVEQAQAQREAEPVTPTEEDLGYGERDEPELFFPGATQSPQEPRNAPSVAAVGTTSTALEFKTPGAMWAALEQALPLVSNKKIMDELGDLGAHMTGGGTRRSYYEMALAHFAEV